MRVSVCLVLCSSHTSASVEKDEIISAKSMSILAPHRSFLFSSPRLAIFFLCIDYHFYERVSEGVEEAFDLRMAYAERWCKT